MKISEKKFGDQITREKKGSEDSFTVWKLNHSSISESSDSSSSLSTLASTTRLSCLRPTSFSVFDLFSAEISALGICRISLWSDYKLLEHMAVFNLGSATHKICGFGIFVGFYGFQILWVFLGFSVFSWHLWVFVAHENQQILQNNPQKSKWPWKICGFKNKNPQKITKYSWVSDRSF